MAYTPHTLVTFSGQLTEVSGLDEQWQIGIRVINPLPPASPIDPGQLSNYVNDIVNTAPLASTWFQDGGGGIPSVVKLQQVKVVNIGGDGKYSGAPSIITLNTSGGGGAVSSVPSFCSVALTFTTSRTFGRKLRKGRVFPPNFAIGCLSGTSSISAASQTALATNAKTLLSVVAKTGASYTAKPAVFSDQGGFELITGVKVGNVYDVQRRRKGAVRETYTSSVWP